MDGSTQQGGCAERRHRASQHGHSHATKHALAARMRAWTCASGYEHCWCIAQACPAPRFPSQARTSCIQQHSICPRAMHPTAQHRARRRGARQSLGGNLFMSLTRRDAMFVSAPPPVLRRCAPPCRTCRAWSTRQSVCMPGRAPAEDLRTGPAGSGGPSTECAPGCQHPERHHTHERQLFLKNMLCRSRSWATRKGVKPTALQKSAPGDQSQPGWSVCADSPPKAGLRRRTELHCQIGTQNASAALWMPKKLISALCHMHVCRASRH